MNMKTATLILVMAAIHLSPVAILVITTSLYNYYCILDPPINPLNPPILLGEGDERCGLWQDEYIKLHKGVMKDISEQ